MKTFWLHFLISALAVHILINVTELLSDNLLHAHLIFVGCFFLLWLSSFTYHRSYFRKIPKFLDLAGYFIIQLIKANLKIAHDVLTPKYFMNPAIVGIPLEAKTDLEITLLAHLISLTPGTLSIDVSSDKKTLYVHSMYVKENDVELLKENIKNGFEKKLLALTR